MAYRGRTKDLGLCKFSRCKNPVLDNAGNREKKVRPVTAFLLACLLCAEAPNGTLEERWLIAQTVVYRSAARGLPIERVIYAPGQYQGIELVDPGTYLRLRRQELEENFTIALAAIWMGPMMKVSNFAEPGSADWQSRCELKHIAGRHYFYLCPGWRKQWQPVPNMSRNGERTKQRK